MTQIVKFPKNNTDIPAMLRLLADDIEAGKYGKALEVVTVLNADNLEVFAWGSKIDGCGAHYLLGCAATRMQAPLVKPFFYRPQE